MTATLTRLRRVSPGRPWLIDCQSCQGRGASRTRVLLPSGRRPERALICMACAGTGGLVKRFAA